ncbi:hypothetical protein [Kribbella sp. NPDC051770]|uniref:hypothetical protein n=1 Tax=Kribbella sp. NPDC051770 TaxID=3155413 RepID=UPI0034475391
MHFRDKVDLLVRLAAQLTVPNFGTASAWSPEDGLDALTAGFGLIVAAHREHAAVRRAVAEAATYDETVREFWEQEINQFTEQTIRLLRIEQAEDRTPGDLEPVSATEIIVIGGERAIVEHVNTRPESTDPAFCAELARIWWYGAYRRPS